MIDKLVAAIRHFLPVGDKSERMIWRSEMQQRQTASEQEISRLKERKPTGNMAEDMVFPDRKHGEGPQ